MLLVASRFKLSTGYVIRGVVYLPLQIPLYDFRKATTLQSV